MTTPNTPSHRRRRAMSVDAHVEGVRARDRAVIARTITLVESDNPSHQAKAQDVLTRLLPHAGGATRVGVTGVPGAGKSTFIERLGLDLCAAGHHVAVLAVDPSSSVKGGSILGDKTRMPGLANHPQAFVRPSPSGGALGGVTRKTRETIVVCEAAGFDVVLVETVGVGQSETTVAEMVDTFLVLLLAGAGDELQGIKKGIFEVADVLAVNKADDSAGEHAATRAGRAARQLDSALHLVTPRDAAWRAPVLTCSGLTGDGVAKVWARVVEHRASLAARGLLDARRAEQRVRWTWAMVHEALMHRLRAHPRVQALVPEVERSVIDGTLTPTLAALRLLEAFGESGPSGSSAP